MTTDTVIMLGQSYAGAIVNSWGGGMSWSHHNLNHQFNTITGTVGRIDGSVGRQSATISFIGDGRGLASFVVDENTLPFDISVDVSGVLILRVEIQHTNQGMSLANRSPRLALANALIY